MTDFNRVEYPRDEVAVVDGKWYPVRLADSLEVLFPGRVKIERVPSLEQALRADPSLAEWPGGRGLS